jgi:nucleoside-diphosphate-sugar epimerase
MRVLFIGGTGLISTACAAATVAAGHDLWLVNRGRSELASAVPAERTLIADATDKEQLAAAVAGLEFDVVVQWIAFHPSQVEIDMAVFEGVGQYIFISSASAYEKPPSHWLITESTPTVNPYWDYSQEKIACEQLLRRAHAERGFPMTIVRPSLTYGRSQIPVIIGSWQKPFTIVDRMRRDASIIVPGDGTSIWTMTHNTDFAKGLLGLFAKEAAIGEDFHITSDEALTWNQIYAAVADAAGVEARILHVPSDGIVASDPSLLGSLFGDKIYSAVFDNAKLRSIVPDYAATTRFADGIRESVAWFDAEPRRQAIDHEANARWDQLVEVYEDALKRAAALSSAAPLAER